MGESAGLDIPALLEPIPGDNPAGEDLRLDESPNSIFGALRSFQAKARDIEKRALLEPDRKLDPKAEWSQVLDLAQQALSTKTKDIHISVYLLEAAVRRYGLAGLRDGFHVMSELIERYWDNLYPVADEDGRFDRRMSFLRGLDGGERAGTLIRPIQMIPILPGAWQGAASLNDYREEPESERVRTAMAAVNPAVAMSIFNAGTACEAQFEKLKESLSKFCGDDVPPTGNIREAVVQALGTATKIKELVVPADQASDDISSDSSAEANAGSNVTFSSGTTTTREQALAKLDEVARFFHAHDPHSFVGYGAAEVARWGRTPLPELLAELLQENEGARDALFRRVGLALKSAPEINFETTNLTGE